MQSCSRLCVEREAELPLNPSVPKPLSPGRRALQCFPGWVILTGATLILIPQIEETEKTQRMDQVRRR